MFKDLKSFVSGLTEEELVFLIYKKHLYLNDYINSHPLNYPLKARL